MAGQKNFIFSKYMLSSYFIFLWRENERRNYEKTPQSSPPAVEV